MSKEKIISIRLYEEMLEALDSHASKQRKGRTQIIREAITRYLNLPSYAIEGKLDILENKTNSIDEKIDLIEKKGEVYEKELQLVREKLDNESRKTIVLEEELRELRSLVFELVKKKK